MKTANIQAAVGSCFVSVCCSACFIAMVLQSTGCVVAVGRQMAAAVLVSRDVQTVF